MGAHVGEAIKKVPGVVDVEDGIENTISGPARTFSVDPVAAARAGFTPQELELDASAIMQGEPAPNPWCSTTVRITSACASRRIRQAISTHP